MERLSKSPFGKYEHLTRQNNYLSVQIKQYNKLNLPIQKKSIGKALAKRDKNKLRVNEIS